MPKTVVKGHARKVGMKRVIVRPHTRKTNSSKLKGNAELMKKYIPEWQMKNIRENPNRIYGFWYVENVPPSVAEKLFKGKPRLDPMGTQNYSPTMRRMVSLAEQYNGTLSGYVIPLESGRSDARITFDGFVLKGSDEQMKNLKRTLRPDEFDKINGGYRFWWD